MTQINSFRDLTVWQVSMDLADVCFDIVEAIPHPYRFTFADQLIPLAFRSLPTLLKEAADRQRLTSTTCRTLLGSHGEVETLFELIRRRKLVPDPLLSKGFVLIDPVGKMLHGLVESLETRDSNVTALVIPVTDLIPNPKSLIPEAP